MDLSHHIEDLITAYKSTPTSEWRNRVIGHLRNAQAASNMIDDQHTDFNLKYDSRALERVCSCSPGVLDNACYLHGGLNRG
jgi:hypothetical protein